MRCDPNDPPSKASDKIRAPSSNKQPPAPPMMAAEARDSKSAGLYARFLQQTSIKRGIGRKELWDSLPVASKLFTCLLVLDVLLCVYTLVHQLQQNCQVSCNTEELQMLVVICMAVVAFAWSTYDAILSENAFQLLLSGPTMIVAGLGLTCLSLKWYSPETVDRTSGYQAATVIVVVVVLANAWLGYLTWHQFGWRMHSRFGCDLRRKLATERLELFFLTNRFRSLLKADIQFLLLVCANGVVIALGRLLEPQRRLPQDSRGMCIGMLVCCFAGLVLQYLWVRICQAAVHKCDRNLESTATVTVGGLAFWPLIMAYLVLLGRWPSTSSGQATILVPLGVWLVLRMALWWHMKVLIEVLEEPDMRAALSSSGGEADVLGADDLPQALAPLIRGAWLIKRSNGSPAPACGVGGLLHSAVRRCAPMLLSDNKRRFFQLSADLTTLRWAWNKYVLLFYVEEVLPKDSELSITLVLTMEADLVLGFQDKATYEQWKAGFKVLLNMLMAPGPVAGGAAAAAAGDGAGPGAGAMSAQRSLVMHAMGLGGYRSANSSQPGIMTRLGGSRRHSTADPHAQRLKEAQDWAAKSLVAAAQQLGHLQQGGLMSSDSIASAVDRSLGLRSKSQDLFASRRSSMSVFSDGSEGGDGSPLSARGRALRAIKLPHADSLGTEGEDVPSTSISSQARQGWREGGSSSGALKPSFLITAAGLLDREQMGLQHQMMELGQQPQHQQQPDDVPVVGLGLRRRHSEVRQLPELDTIHECSGSSTGRASRSADAEFSSPASPTSSTGRLRQQGEAAEQPGGASAAAAAAAAPAQSAEPAASSSERVSADPAGSQQPQPTAGSDSSSDSAAIPRGPPVTPVPSCSSRSTPSPLQDLQDLPAGPLLGPGMQLRTRESTISIGECVSVHGSTVNSAAATPVHHRSEAGTGEEASTSFYSGSSHPHHLHHFAFSPRMHSMPMAARRGAGSWAKHPDGLSAAEAVMAERGRARSAGAAYPALSAPPQRQPSIGSDSQAAAAATVAELEARLAHVASSRQEGQGSVASSSSSSSPSSSNQPWHSDSSSSSSTLAHQQQASAASTAAAASIEPSTYKAATAAPSNSSSGQAPDSPSGRFKVTWAEGVASEQQRHSQGKRQQQHQQDTPPSQQQQQQQQQQHQQQQQQQQDQQDEPYMPPSSTLLDRYKPQPGGKLQVITDVGSPPAHGTIRAVWNQQAPSPADSPTSQASPAWGHRQLHTVLSSASQASTGSNVVDSAASSPAAARQQPSPWGSPPLSYNSDIYGLPAGHAAAAAAADQPVSGTSTWSQLSHESGRTIVVSGRRALSPQVSIELIDYSQLVMGKFLGSGAEGAVYAAWYQETPVAVKKTSSAAEVEMNLAAGFHDNVVALRGLCQQGASWHLVMEYCPRGTLDVMLRHSSPSNKWEVGKLLQIVRSVARGMLHLHTRRPPVLHRDLKPANIFVGHGLVMKIGDLGMSRHINMAPPPAPGAPPPPGTPGSLSRTLTPGVVGTVAYAAPEVLDELLQQPDAPGERLLKADVYSYGVTVWEVLERRRPHEGMDTFQMTAMWMSSPELMALPPVTIPDGLSAKEQQVMAALGELVASCTALEPDARPSFQQILMRLKQLQQVAMGGDRANEGADLMV